MSAGAGDQSRGGAWSRESREASASSSSGIVRRRTRSSQAYRSRSLSAAAARRAAAVSAPGGAGEAGSTDEGNCPIKEVGGCSKASAVFECAHRHLREGAAKAQPLAHICSKSGPPRAPRGGLGGLLLDLEQMLCERLVAWRAGRSQRAHHSASWASWASGRAGHGCAQACCSRKLEGAVQRTP